MKNIKRNLSSRTLGFMLIGSLMMFAVPSFAQNHNPEFEISDVHLGGSDYVFIPPDAEATPFRTAVPLQYRDDNIPENGSTTLSWESGDKINVYEIGVTSALDLTQSPTWSDADQGNKSLELEAHLDAGEGDSQTLQAIYTNPDGDDSPVGEREFTLVKLDLDVDANYDGTINDDDEADEASAGGLVFLNDDDDDQDSTPDKDQDGAVAGEDDLIEIKLSLDPDLGEGEVRLEVVSGSDNIKVWDDSTKTTEIDLSETWDLSSDTLPSSLFVEAIAESSSPRDVELILTYQPDDTLEITDSIVLTLLQVDVAVRNNGISIRDNGNLVKIGNSLEFALSPEYFDQEDSFEDVISWEFCQREANGQYTAWESFGEHATGANFTHTPEIGGIYRVRANLGSIASFEFLRKQDDKGGTHNWKFGPGLKDQPDSIGVCYKQIQINICKEAQSFYASDAYAAENVLPPEHGFPEYPASGNSVMRCNIFVAHRATAVGATVPAINGHFNEYPPLANEWAGIEDTSIWPGDPTHIENWPILSSSTRPQPGWIIAHPNEGDSGHVAITDYDGEGIGAGSSGTVNKLFFQFWDGTSRLRYYAP
jgi:hypothetical protein